VEYRQGVLANFASPQILTQLKTTPKFVELPTELTNDRELGLFMRSAFGLNELRSALGEETFWYRDCEVVAEAVKQAIIYPLRPMGLP
jgi:hypothetical protein